MEQRYYVASEDSEMLRSDARGGGMEHYSEEVPVGTCHAVPVGDDRPVCGIDGGNLVHLTEVFWGQSSYHKQCRECSAALH